MTTKLISLLTLLTFFSCASEPFKTGRPIESHGNFITRNYTQDGKSVSVNDVFRNLKLNETSKAKASTGQTWYYTGLVAGAIGGFLVGSNLFSNSDNKTNNMLLGLGLIGAAGGAAYYADQNLSEALESYNRRSPRKRGEFFLTPSFGVAEFRESRQNSLANSSTQSSFGPALGLQIIF